MTPFRNSVDTDALTELFNIGLHRAAASLSDLTNQRVNVDLPRLWVCPVNDLKDMLTELVDGDLATVHQIFGGTVTGDAVLMLEYEKAALLAKVMTEGQVAVGGQIDHSAREVLTEVGNIVLGACLSAFGNMLKVSVTFSVPRMHVESLDGLMRSLQIDHSEVQYAMVATTRFQLSGTEIGGYLIIVIGLSSLQLITSVMQKELE
jgi:chemotaxis protein CheC